MARTIVTISSDLFDEDQQVSVRDNLPVRTLLAEIRKEFDLAEGSYSLKLQQTNKVLDPEKTLEQQNIQTGGALAFIRERRAAAIVNQPMTASNTNLPGMGNMRQPIFGKTKAFLKESSTGEIFEINWSPAIIGRPDANNPASANALAVNLATHMEGRTVSRRHAQVTEYGGHFFAESLNPDNPTLVNDAAVQIGEKRLMQSGDRIQVGKITLEFGLKLG